MSIDTAKRLSCAKVAVHISEKSGDNSKAQSISNLVSYARYARRKGVSLCIENRTPPEAVGFSKEEVSEILFRVKKQARHVRLCFDTGHAIASCGSKAGALDFLASVAKDVGMVHLVPGTADGDIHTSFDLDPHFYRKTISTLAEAGYQGALTLEVMPEIPEEIILEGARYLRATVAEVLYELG